MNVAKMFSVKGVTWSYGRVNTGSPPHTHKYISHYFAMETFAGVESPNLHISVASWLATFEISQEALSWVEGVPSQTPSDLSQDL